LRSKKISNVFLYDYVQVDLLISFCSEMGLRSVVLVGHDDGGLLALKAAEKLRTCGHHIKVT
jgi:pimeloyl-ACP methyl ester carboxylesterase